MMPLGVWKKLELGSLLTQGTLILMNCDWQSGSYVAIRGVVI